MTAAVRFEPGDLVVRREILRGEVWYAFPTICVEDSPDLLALYLPSGASSAFPTTARFPCGRHPWHELSYWRTYTGRVDLATTVLASLEHDASILTRENRYGDGDLPVIGMPA